MKALPFESIGDFSYNPSFYDRETARGTEIVAMDANGSVTCSPEEEKRIATFGLLACTAAALVLERTDGRRRGYIQHYSFRHEGTGVQALGDELRAHASDLRVARLVVMTPGRLGSSGRFPLEPTNDALANTLALTGRTYLGEAADVQIYGYEETQKLGATDQGTLMIELLAGGSANVVADGRLIRPATEGS